MVLCRINVTGCLIVVDATVESETCRGNLVDGWFLFEVGGVVLLQLRVDLRRIG